MPWAPPPAHRRGGWAGRSAVADPGGHLREILIQPAHDEIQAVSPFVGIVNAGKLGCHGVVGVDVGVVDQAVLLLRVDGDVRKDAGLAHLLVRDVQ